jgi:phenylacetate-coenzyme A ligase PaaK-like adenylate-forming protein
LTIFERFTQPLIRYEISDRIRLTSESCPCGRPYRVIESIEGRQEDVLHFELIIARRLRSPPTTH